MKLLIVDDHAVVRAGVRRLFAAEPRIGIREAATGQEALGAFREFHPDLVLLDLNLPGIGGLEVIGRLKAEDAKVRILVLSMHDNPLYAARALQAGAKGYVSKSAPPEQIVEAVNRVAAGHSYIEHEIAQVLALQTVHAEPNPLSDLSVRDLEILRRLGDGTSLFAIADAIGVSYKTVANHCSRMKAKLGAARTADLIRIAIASGLSSGNAGIVAATPEQAGPDPSG